MKTWASSITYTIDATFLRIPTSSDGQSRVNSQPVVQYKWLVPIPTNNGSLIMPRMIEKPRTQSGGEDILFHKRDHWSTSPFGKRGSVARQTLSKLSRRSQLDTEPIHDTNCIGTVWSMHAWNWIGLITELSIADEVWQNTRVPAEYCSSSTLA